jgi:UDP-N-acetylmuramoyl-tripeptide--D-alanyl-D-alanine ligase
MNKTLFELFTECNYTISTDSRSLPTGCLFFAITGDKFDGHDFAQSALTAGAAYVVVQSNKVGLIPVGLESRYILVTDTLLAIQELAKIYRETFSIPILAIGGSNGKTTTKELTHSVCSIKFKTHSTRFSQNNHLGVPLTILSMPKDTEIGIFEIGANHHNEHTELLSVLKPNHVLITNNGSDHLEGFIDQSGVRKANKEIYDYAKIAKSHAFVCDTQIDLLEDSSGLERTIYGYNRYSEYIFGKQGTMYASITHKDQLIQSNLVGEYNRENIMAAGVIGLYFGLSLDDVVLGIKNYQPSLMRSEIREKNNLIWIVDCYNANPSSMTAALDNYEKYQSNEKYAILGDMFELGESSWQEHYAILERVKRAGYALVICIGSDYNKHNCKDQNILFFPDHTSAKEYIINKPNLFPFRATLLLKGSRGMKMEQCLDYIKA